MPCPSHPPWLDQSNYTSIPDRSKNFFSYTAPRQVVGPAPLPIQWVQVALSLRLRRAGREADRSPSSSVELKNDGAVPPLPYMSSWRGV
jgi:hypothetical protein